MVFGGSPHGSSTEWTATRPSHLAACFAKILWCLRTTGGLNSLSRIQRPTTLDAHFKAIGAFGRETSTPARHPGRGYLTTFLVWHPSSTESLPFKSVFALEHASPHK